MFLKGGITKKILFIKCLLFRFMYGKMANKGVMQLLRGRMNSTVKESVGIYSSSLQENTKNNLIKQGANHLVNKGV